jgi:hypothetical protein
MLLLLSGCRSLFADPLEAAYRSGSISTEEYNARRQVREERLARAAPAHWELRQLITQNQSKLPAD